jgi:hypothetical protein
VPSGAPKSQTQNNLSQGDISRCKELQKLKDSISCGSVINFSGGGCPIDGSNLTNDQRIEVVKINQQMKGCP